MATTLTRNLKLRVNSNLTADARYNLLRLDLLGSTFIVDTTNNLNIRSEADVLIEPESADIGGSGVGGTVSLGTPSHSLNQVNIFSDTLEVSSPISLLDQADGGDKFLQIRYKSDSEGAVDVLANRILSLDLEGADRSLILGGDLQLGGGNLSLSMTGDSSLILPEEGTLATLAGAETLTNKSINAPQNNITNIANANIAANAAIAYPKLNLASSIVVADLDPSFSLPYSRLTLTGSVTTADLDPGFILNYPQLNLLGSIRNQDVDAAAAISYSKLNLSNSLLNSDLDPSFSLDGSQVDPDFGAQVISTSESLRFQEAFTTDLRAAQAGQIESLIFTLPANVGLNNQVLTTDGSGNLSWTTAAGSGTVKVYAEEWETADGLTKTITHNLGSLDVQVSVIDLDDNTMHLVSSIEVLDANTIELNASEAPANGWQVVVQA